MILVVIFKLSSISFIVYGFIMSWIILVICCSVLGVCCLVVGEGGREQVGKSFEFDLLWLVLAFIATCIVLRVSRFLKVY